MSLLLASLMLAESSAPAYAYRAEVDLPVTAISATIAVGWLYRHQLSPAWCAPRCDETTLNALDRQTAGRWSPRWSTTSDLSIATMALVTLATPFVDEGASGWSDAIVIGESLLVANALSVISATGTRRPRPYMYGDEAPLDDRKDGNGSLSFFSGHTAGAFAAAFSAFGVLKRRHPEASWTWGALGAFVAGAAFVGTGRLLAGQHFPTDVLGGVVVGTSVGILVPALHDRPVQVAAAPTTGGATFALSGFF